MRCKICDKSELAIVYDGKIRKGKFPNYQDNALIYQCRVCKTQMFEGLDIDYETEEYRELVDSGSSAQTFYEMHDREQASRLSFFDVADFRNAIVADVGSGAGSFLDLIKGFAGKTIAIEPAKQYHPSLKEKGHLVFSYSPQALKEFAQKADLVTCFSVIEHIDDPVPFLTELVALCKPGGTIIISTPNADDWLIDFLPETYKPFFYRVVHKWYLNADSIQHLANQVGLTNITIKYKQRFNLTNTLNWIKEGKPTGNSSSFFSPQFESLYQAQLEEKGKSDYIYMIAKKKN